MSNYYDLFDVLTEELGNMYAHMKTYNPYKGCRFDCVYCRPSFQTQAKRHKRRCLACGRFEPHEHPERLGRFPSKKLIFVCGNGDISFCDPAFTEKIITSIWKHNLRCPEKEYYFQSKRPEYFTPFLDLFPANVTLVTTLETDDDQGYEYISKAPPPTERYAQFKALDYLRKVVTIEPVMKFNVHSFAEMIVDLEPEHVWFGFNSRHKSVQIPEPTEQEIFNFLTLLKENGIELRAKKLRPVPCQLN